MPLWVFNLLIALCVVGMTICYIRAEKQVHHLAHYILENELIDVEDDPCLKEMQHLIKREDMVILGSGIKGQDILESCLGALMENPDTAVNTCIRHEGYTVYTTIAGVNVYYVDASCINNIRTPVPQGIKYRAYIQADISIDAFDDFNNIWKPYVVSVLKGDRKAH